MTTTMLPSKVLTRAHEIILERWSPQGDDGCNGGRRCALGAVAEVTGAESWWDAGKHAAGLYLDAAAASFTDDGYPVKGDVVWINDKPSTQIGDISDLFLDAIDDAKADEADARKQVLALL